MIENITECVVEAFSPNTFCPPKVKLVGVNLAILKQKIAGCEQKAALLYLNAAEQERFHDFRYVKRKVEWLGGRIAVKCAALQFVMNSRKILWNENWSRMYIASTDHGKPFLQDSFPRSVKLPGISISHTSGHAMGMACDGNCGVDVQRITPAVERVQDRFCSHGEQKGVAAIADQYNQQIALAFLWSAKEAVKKAVPAQQSVPGFMEIFLCDVKKAHNGYLFEMEVPIQGESIKARASVWACLWRDLSFAMAVL